MLLPGVEAADQLGGPQGEVGVAGGGVAHEGGDGLVVDGAGPCEALKRVV